MIEHVFSVLCSQTSIDSETNTVSLFNVLEQLTVFTESTENIRIPIHFEILSLWTRQSPDVPERGKARIIFCSPSNQQKQQVEMTLDLSKATNYRSKLVSDGIELTGPGKYYFVVEFMGESKQEWQTVARLPLSVNYQAQPSS
jgi:hypothetical protein